MKFTEFTDRGSRSENDDYVLSSNRNGIYIFSAADGMGTGGRLASELVLKTITEEFEKDPMLDRDALKGYITQAQRALLQKKASDRKYDTVNTTAAVLLTNGSEAVWAHCGDTRIYVICGRRISEVTDDHSEAFEKFTDGELSFADIRTSPLRRRLRRAIGDAISWEPEISEVKKINSSFSFLICTDGFWNLINEEEIERAMGFSSSSGWLQRMLKIISRRLTPKSDNLTAVTVRFQKGDFV